MLDIFIKVIVEASKVDKAKLIAVLKVALQVVYKLAAIVAVAKLVLEAVLAAVGAN